MTDLRVSEDGKWVEISPGRWRLRREGDQVAAGGDRPKGPEIRVMPDFQFVSTSLPRNYKHHADLGGRFTDDGSVVIESRRQLDKLVEYGNERGENCHYAGPGREIYPD